MNVQVQYPQMPPLDRLTEQQWLQRFLLGELDPAQADAFEAYALDKPHLLDQLEADLQLARGLEGLADRGELPLPLPATAPASRRPRAWPWLGMAACLAAGWVGARWQGMAMPEPVRAASPERLVFETVRGGEGERSLAPDGAAAASRLVIVDVVLSPLASLESARLHSGAGDVPLGGARVDRDGVLTLVLERSSLPGTELVLSLRDAEGQHEQRYPLDQARVVPN